MKPSTHRKSQQMAERGDSALDDTSIYDWNMEDGDADSESIPIVPNSDWSSDFAPTSGWSSDFAAACGSVAAMEGVGHDGCHGKLKERKKRKAGTPASDAYSSAGCGADGSDTEDVDVEAACPSESRALAVKKLKIGGTLDAMNFFIAKPSKEFQQARREKEREEAMEARKSLAIMKEHLDEMKEERVRQLARERKRRQRERDRADKKNEPSNKVHISLLMVYTL